MAKFRVPTSSGTTLDPYSFEKSLMSPQELIPKADPNFGTGVADQLEFVTPVKIEEGYGTLGNARVAAEYQQARKAYDEDGFSLAGKFLKNVAGTVVTEVGKLPGYVVGGGMAIGNELLGDGKDSMRLMVDNQWVNAFESLDQSIKDFMPVTLAKSVSEGGLGDKLGSGAWWATTGADGVGFLLSMFAPGAALKAAKLGKAIAPAVEGIVNLGDKVDNVLNLPFNIGRSTPFILEANGQRKAAGLMSMFANASFESASEAANTFDNVKKNNLALGLTEDEANAKAGEAAASVFKTNMLILPISNMLDEIYLFKSLGKMAEKKAGESALGKIFRDGVIDTEAIAKLSKFATVSNLTKYLTKIGGNVAKEGFFEEGLQTITQQQVESDNIKDNPLDQLLNSISTYTDDFWNNKELHESIALGGILGGGMSIISTTQDINNLRSAIHGKTAKSNWATKLGLAQEGVDQRGLASIITQNFNDNFRSIKDLQIVNEDGKTVIDQTKLQELPEQQRNLIAAHLAYDAAVSSNDEVAKAQLGALLAENYVGAFIGNESSEHLFNEHVEKQLLPSWSQRYEEQYGRQPTSEQQKEFVDTFKSQGKTIFDSYNKAVNTHQPERYLKPEKDDPIYPQFKQQYFREKYQTLLQINTLNNLLSDINQELTEAGIPSLVIENNEITNLDAVQRQTLKDRKKVIDEAKEIKSKLEEHYSNLFSKKGVKELYDVTKAKIEAEQQFEQNVVTTQAATVAEAQTAIITNDQRFERFAENYRNAGYDPGEIVQAQDKDGNVYDVVFDPDTNQFVAEGMPVDGELIDKAGLEIIPKTLAEVIAPTTDSTFDKLKAEFFTDDVSDAEASRLINVLKNGSLQEIAKEFGVTETVASAMYQKYLDIVRGETTTPINDEVVEETPLPDQPEIPEVEESNETPAWELNDQSNTPFPSTGLHVQYTSERGRTVDKINQITGLPILNESKEQQRWFNKVSEINHNDYSVRVVSYGSIGKLSPTIQAQIKSNLGGETRDTDLFVILAHHDGTFIQDNNGIFFSSLWRPETLYKQLDGKFLSRLAPGAWLGRFLKVNGITSELELIQSNFKRLSLEDRKKLGLSETSNYTDLELAAFEWAKEDYQNWYNKLNAQQDKQVILSIGDKSKGKQLTRRNSDGSIMWNPVIGNIPGIKFQSGKMLGGELIQSYDGKIQVLGKDLSARPGETLLVTKEGHVHPLKQRKLNIEEVRQVLFLLTLRQTGGTLESIRLSVEVQTNQNTKTVSVPVFWAEEKFSLINSFINFSTKVTDKKYSIFFEGQNLSWITENGTKQTIPQTEIMKSKELVDFLKTKNFNINEKLLKENKRYMKSEIKINSKGEQVLTYTASNESFQEHLINSKSLLTKAVVAPGYPNRLQVNLHLNPEIKTADNNVEDLSEFDSIDSTEEVAPVPEPRTPRSRPKPPPPLEVDKIFSPQQLLDQKLKSGEIKQICK